MIICEIADRIRREGKEEGRIPGILEGKTEAILELLEDLGKTPQQVISRIRRETDLEQLGKLYKCAAHVSSIAEFESKM